MRRIDLTSTVLIAVVFAVAFATVPSTAFTETYDPFVSQPFDSYALLSNPLASLEANTFAVRGAVGVDRAGGGTTQLIAYQEPDMGFGAGSVLWHRSQTADNTVQRVWSYIMAREVGNYFNYGLALKSISEDGIGGWAVDMGLQVDDVGPFRATFVARNFLGATDINPVHMTGSLSTEFAPALIASVSLAAPSLVDTNDMKLGIAVDTKLSDVARLRFARVSDMTSAHGYWQASGAINIQSLTVDGSIFINDTGQRRFVVGTVYRY